MGTGFYSNSSHHGHPVCLTSYQAHNETSMPQPCPALPPPAPSPDTKQKRKNKGTTITHLRSALVILALSIHSLFEGMAVGLEESDSGVWKLFLAIAIHGSAIALCIGTEMVTTGIKKRSIVLYITVLSLFSPLGVLIGILVSIHAGDETSASQLLAIGILQGLAAGT